MRYICSRCDATYSISPLRYQCDCGSPLMLETWRGTNDWANKGRTGTGFPRTTTQGPLSLWRYREALPIPEDTDIVTLGEGMTPLIPLNAAADSGHYVKLDYLCPTGSYKDRGASVLLTHLKALGVAEVVEDSSGNAGAAIAAYSARAGIRCTIYCPASTSKGKLAQIAAYGAALRLVEGNRMATTEAVKDSAKNTCYASHNWHPFFLEGTKTLAFEIVAQLDGNVPKHIICPVGFGSIYLGLFIGFRELHEAGVIEEVPRLLGVQPAVCCPIYKASLKGHPRKGQGNLSLQDAGQQNRAPIKRMVQTGPTLAEGITAEQPIRGQLILEAMRYSNGAFTIVDDAEIKAGLDKLAARGIYVEPTSAVVIKGYEKFRDAGIIGESETTVSILTGIGLKAKPVDLL